MRRLKPLMVAGATASLALAAGTASASLVFLGPGEFQGTGLGNVSTLLTLQSPGNTINESGTSRVNASGQTEVLGNAQPGQAQSGTPTLASLGAANASLLRIVLNANEPQNTEDRSLLLNTLEMRLYNNTGGIGGATQQNPAGTSFSIAAPINFAETFPGTGNAGFIFGLDAPQAGIANTLVQQGYNRIGITASLSNAQGGPETFFAYAVPEPSTYALLLAGLGVLGFIARRRTRGL